MRRRRGCVNVHASLLPRWRGAAPIQRAILAGDEVSGVTIMQMDEGLDTGPMLLKRELDIRGKNAGQVTEEMAKLGARALIEWLERSDARRSRSPRTARLMPPRSTRPKRGSTGRSRPRRSSARSAPSLRCPAPGSRPTASGSSCSRPKSGAMPAGKPGEVLDDCLTVAGGDGCVRPLKVQRAGRRRDDARRIAARLRDPQGHDPPVTRWRLTIEYDGGPFMGWQRQDHGPSVQQTLEEALAADDRRAATFSRRAHRRRASTRWR